MHTCISHIYIYLFEEHISHLHMFETMSLIYTHIHAHNFSHTHTCANIRILKKARNHRPCLRPFTWCTFAFLHFFRHADISICAFHADISTYLMKECVWKKNKFEEQSHRQTPTHTQTFTHAYTHTHTLTHTHIYIQSTGVTESSYQNKDEL